MHTLSIRGGQHSLHCHLLSRKAAFFHIIKKRLHVRQRLCICLQHSSQLSCLSSLNLCMHLHLYGTDLISVNVMSGHLMLLGHIDLLDPGLIISQHIYIPEKAGIGQTRTPVPTEHAGRLAQLGEASHRLSGALRSMSLVCHLYKFSRRMEKKTQVIVRCG